MSAAVPYTSAEEERRWNRLSERMKAFHQWFKDDFKMIYDLADGSFTKQRLSLPLFLDKIDDFNSHLTTHHTIEERYVFPVLAKRIPKFADGADDGHVNSHRAIHKGLSDLGGLVSKWRDDLKSYSPAEIKACLDSFRDVLFNHLDEEVADLRGDVLRPYFTLEEVERIGS